MLKCQGVIVSPCDLDPLGEGDRSRDEVEGDIAMLSNWRARLKPRELLTFRVSPEQGRECERAEDSSGLARTP